MRMRFAAAMVMAWLAAGPAMCWSGVTLQSAGLSGSGGGTLFTSVGAPASQAGQVMWAATLDLTLLGSLPPTLVVNFPDRASVTLTRLRAETRGSGTYVWTGRGGGCTAVLNVAPTNVYGAISCVTGNYSVTGMGPTLQLAHFVGSASNTAAFEPAPVGATPIQYAEPKAVQPSGAQIDTVVDVLVLYTDGVRQYFDPNGGSARTRQIAQAAIDIVQTAMDQITTPGQPTIANVRLAGVSEVSRTATGDLVDDQKWLGQNPEPAALRDFWAADIVMYLTLDGTNGAFGLANGPGNGSPAPGPGFAPAADASLVARCAVLALAADCPQPYIFAHEIAHLFGANHNPESNGNPTPLEPWAFANWAHNGADGNGAHTLVSYYAKPCAPTLSQCATVLYYSNAAVYDDWFRTGIPERRENARVIAEFAPATAQYRLSIGRIFYDGFQF